MRGVAGGAAARFHRFAQILIFGVVDRPLLQSNRVFMTFSTGFPGGFFQQTFLFGAVGIVAVQTSDLISQRPMHAAFGENRINRIAVTLPAQFRPLFFCPCGVRRACSEMTCGTFVFGNRRMDLIV